jgi:hypothetical protein
VVLKPHSFWRGILTVAESALWTFLIIALLMLVFVILFGFMLFLLLKYPQIPTSWLWPAVWTGMGLIVISLAALYFWWGSVLKDRETLESLFQG